MPFADAVNGCSEPVQLVISELMQRAEHVQREPQRLRTTDMLRFHISGL